MLVGATRQRVHAANAGEANKIGRAARASRRILVVAIERLIEERVKQHQRRATRADRGQIAIAVAVLVKQNRQGAILVERAGAAKAAGASLVVAIVVEIVAERHIARQLVDARIDRAVQRRAVGRQIVAVVAQRRVDLGVGPQIAVRVDEKVLVHQQVAIVVEPSHSSAPGNASSLSLQSNT
jgi:hypothetical protein